MTSPRLIANIIIVIILLSLIVATAEEDEGSGDGNDTDYGEIITWPADETFHDEWNNQVIPLSGGGTGVAYSYNDHDFEVSEFATGGVILVDNFQRLGVEDVDILVLGSNVDDNGDRVVVARSANNDNFEKIILEGTPDPVRNDDFDRGGNGTWTLRVENWASLTVGVVYDASVDIYYDGAEYHSS